MPSRRIRLFVIGVSLAILKTQPSLAQAAVPKQHQLEDAYQQLIEARDLLASQVSECYGGMVMVLTCGPLPPSRAGSTCPEAVSSCEVLAAFRATNAALAELKKVSKP